MHRGALRLNAFVGTAAMMLRPVSMIAIDSAAPLKVLCLHGYTQNGNAIRDRSAGFRRPLKQRGAMMSYVDGPFGCTANGEEIAEADADLLRRAWWCVSADPNPCAMTELHTP